MPYFYDQDGEDPPFDLVEYPIISCPDPVSFSAFALQQFNSLRVRVCLKGIYLLTDTNPNRVRKGSKLFLSGRKDFDLISFQFRAPGPFLPCPRE